MEAGSSTPSRSRFEASRAAAMASIDAALRKSSSVFAVAQSRLGSSSSLSFSPDASCGGVFSSSLSGASASVRSNVFFPLGRTEAETTLQRVLRDRFSQPRSAAFVDSPKKAGVFEGVPLSRASVTPQIERQLECVCVVTNLQQAEATGSRRGTKLPEYLHKPVAVSLGLEVEREEVEKRPLLQPLPSALVNPLGEDSSLGPSRKQGGESLSGIATLDLATNAAVQAKAQEGASSAFLRRVRVQSLSCVDPEVLDGFRPAIPRALADASRRKAGLPRVDIPVADTPQEVMSWKFRSKPSASEEESEENRANGGQQRLDLADLISQLSQQPLEVYRQPEKQKTEAKALTPASKVRVGKGLPKPPAVDEGESREGPKVQAIRAGRLNAVMTSLDFDEFPTEGNAVSTRRRKKPLADKCIQTEALPSVSKPLTPSVSPEVIPSPASKLVAPSSLRALSSSDECSSDGLSSSSEESEFLPQAEDAATDNSSSAVSSPLEESSDPLDPESADFPMKVAEFWKNQMEEQNRLFYEGVRDAMLGLPQRTLPTLAFPPASEPQAADSAEAALASSFLFNLFSASKRPFFESSSASAATGALPSTDFPELTTSKEGAASLASLAPDVFSVFAPDFAAFLQRNPFAIPALECSSQEEQWCQWMAEQHRYFQEAQMEMAERRDSQAGARQLEFSSEGDEARPRESSVDASEKSEDSRERWRRQVRELRGAMQESVSGDFVPCIRGGFRFSRQSRRRNGASSRRRKSGKNSSPSDSSLSPRSEEEFRSQIEALSRRGRRGGGRTSAAAFCRGGRFSRVSSAERVVGMGRSSSLLLRGADSEVSKRDGFVSEDSNFSYDLSPNSREVDCQFSKSIACMEASLGAEVKSSLPRVRASIQEMSSRLHDKQNALRVEASLQKTASNLSSPQNAKGRKKATKAPRPPFFCSTSVVGRVSASIPWPRLPLLKKGKEHSDTKGAQSEEARHSEGEAFHVDQNFEEASTTASSLNNTVESCDAWIGLPLRTDDNASERGESLKASFFGVSVLPSQRRKAALDFEEANKAATSSAQELSSFIQNPLSVSTPATLRRVSPEDEVVPALASGRRMKELYNSLSNAGSSSPQNLSCVEASTSLRSSPCSEKREEDAPVSARDSNVFSESTPLRPPARDAPAWWERKTAK